MNVMLILGSLLCFLRSANGQCDATLKVDSLTGPPQCTPNGIAQLQDAKVKALSECFLECASGYNIHVSDATAAGGSNLQALATPKTKTCSKEDINLKVLCSPVPLTCAKPFTEFPNACTGVLPLVSGVKVYVAFYTYCTHGISSYESILDTQAIFNADTICRGIYKYDTQSGTCMGLPQGKDTCQQAGIPPEPPRIAESPMRFPLVGAGSGQCQASIMPNTVTGPIGCTEDSLPKIPDAQARAVIECFHECAQSYTLSWDMSSSWHAAVATPKKANREMLKWP